MDKISYWDMTKISIAFLLGTFGTWFTAGLGDMPEFLGLGIVLLLTATWIVERVFRPIEKSLKYFKKNTQLIISRTSYVIGSLLLLWGFLFLPVGIECSWEMIFWGSVSTVVGVLTDPKFIHLSLKKYSITHLKL